MLNALAGGKVFHRFLHSLGRGSIVRTESLCWNNKLIDNDHSILNLFMRHLTLPNSFNLPSPQPFHEAPDLDMFVIINSQFLFWTRSIALSIYILRKRCSYFLFFLSLSQCWAWVLSFLKDISPIFKCLLPLLGILWFHKQNKHILFVLHSL